MAKLLTTQTGSGKRKLSKGEEPVSGLGFPRTGGWGGGQHRTGGTWK